MRLMVVLDKKNIESSLFFKLLKRSKLKILSTFFNN